MQWTMTTATVKNHWNWQFQNVHRDRSLSWSVALDWWGFVVVAAADDGLDLHVAGSVRSDYTATSPSSILVLIFALFAQFAVSMFALIFLEARVNPLLLYCLDSLQPFDCWHTTSVSSRAVRPTSNLQQSAMAVRMLRSSRCKVHAWWSRCLLPYSVS